NCPWAGYLLSPLASDTSRLLTRASGRATQSCLGKSRSPIVSWKGIGSGRESIWPNDHGEPATAAIRLRESVGRVSAPWACEPAAEPEWVVRRRRRNDSKTVL